MSSVWEPLFHAITPLSAGFALMAGAAFGFRYVFFGMGVALVAYHFGLVNP